MKRLKFVVRTVRSLELLSKDEINLYEKVVVSTLNGGIKVTAKEQISFKSLIEKGLVSKAESNKAVIVLHNYILKVKTPNYRDSKVLSWFKSFILAPDLLTAFHHAEHTFQDRLVGIERNDVSESNQHSLDEHIESIEESFANSANLYLMKDYDPLILLRKDYLIDYNKYEIVPIKFTNDVGLIYEECQNVEGQRSASVGDIIEVKETLFIVLGIGYKKVQWNDIIDFTSKP